MVNPIVQVADRFRKGGSKNRRAGLNW